MTDKAALMTELEKLEAQLAALPYSHDMSVHVARIHLEKARQLLTKTEDLTQARSTLHWARHHLERQNNRGCSSCGN